MVSRSVLIEADGGSRGNPGAAAYGAVLLDAETREVIAERAEYLGVATNNVAEYSGLVAGLELYREHTPGARLEVRMDSKLVVEQMSGRWKIKHQDMRALAERARALAPAGTTYTWIPREQNKHADRILNAALDAQASGRPAQTAVEAQAPAQAPAASATEQRGWSPGGAATTLVLVRHGVTGHTLDKRFSGGLGGSDPGLVEEGRAQVRATGDWLAPLAGEIDTVVASPVRRTRESAEILAERLDKPLVVEPGLAEMEFGSWDGMTFAEIRERHPDDLDAWLGSLDHAPGGGESFRVVEKRVLAGLERLLAEYGGRTVLAVSHVTPIKVLVAHALGAPLESVYRMEMAPASVTVLSYFADGNAALRMFNARPTDAAFTGR
ncbi:bifunctional RNase H/acid phosphatase [Nocardioides panacis]|uniref:Bifunctional RNase H/acid phosphatase n=1 Tax=Nocardioides panacis TaxID=2849501 RepID=A0A975XYK0_9ACTN|nr:bifunctional RNase H/acid phosphatase [Nocardioides panacis]QWZ06440.1 bifunctional RNase H/acid phosphatase [Nocardioides panacis]